MKTAVEWLQELYDSRPAYEEFILDEEFEQAKQMEKEQMKNMYLKGIGNYDPTFKRKSQWTEATESSASLSAL